MNVKKWILIMSILGLMSTGTIHANDAISDQATKLKKENKNKLDETTHTKNSAVIVKETVHFYLSRYLQVMK